MRLYKYTGGCIFRMSATKTYRHGQILRLVSSERIGNQEDLRRRLAQQRLRVTQATLSRDLQELKLIKTSDGYKTGSALPDESANVAPLTAHSGVRTQTISKMKAWFELQVAIQFGY